MLRKIKAIIGGIVGIALLFIIQSALAVSCCNSASTTGPYGDAVATTACAEIYGTSEFDSYGAAIVFIYQHPIFEGAFLKYEVSVFGQPKTEPLISHAKELFESLKVPLGKTLFLVTLQNATGGTKATAFDTSGELVMPGGPASLCGVFWSSDRISIQVTVETMSGSAYTVNYSVIFSNFSAIGLEKTCKMLPELISPPSEIKGGYLVWRRDSLTLSKKIIVNVSNWNAVDADSGRSLGEWLFWLSPFDLSVNYTLILAGINLHVTAGITPNLSGFVGYVLYLNASNTASRDYVVGGADIKRARTLVAYSYPLAHMYEKVLRAGRVSEEFKSIMRRYGCSVVQHPNSTVEVFCEAFSRAASHIERWKAWKVVPVSMQIDPNLFRTFAAIKYSGLYLAMYPIDFYTFVYDRQTGLLLEASHDPSVESWWGHAILPSAYLSFGNYTLSFKVLNGLINAKLVETNIPLQTPSLGSPGRAEADPAYALLAASAALATAAAIARRWR
jgi:hypothetical protein